jgi:hypothetical protein
MDPFVLAPQLTGDTGTMVNEARKDNVRPNQIIHNRVSGTPLISPTITGRLFEWGTITIALNSICQRSRNPAVLFV